MGQISDTLAEKRHDKAEVEHLRDFYLRWMQLHAQAAIKPIDTHKSQQCAQALVDKAKVLREFYA